MKAKSIKGKSSAEISAALMDSMSDGFSPTLAIISIHQDRNAISNLLDNAGISIYGATTNGEFIDEEIGKNSIAILLLDIKNVLNVPMAGIFSNSELARVTNGNLEVNNLTTCCVALKEK